MGFRPEALDELAEARNWYNGRVKGLGSEFVRAVEARIASIRRMPDAYPVIHGNVRRALLRRFPYAILYCLNGEEVLIIACFHASRNPDEWLERV
ncbi:MAG: type II toxin-antitoxin system RelE/ParE family toxin [Nitrospirae bacterium]|nr:type II toxin-antitoxin system RelE/ParE family toxin [Nitrospirota bacterium]